MRRANMLAVGAALAFVAPLAQGADLSALFAVSQPPVAILESDARAAVIALEPDLSRTRRAFAAEDVGLSLDYLRLDRDGTAFISFSVGLSEDTPGGILVVPDFLARTDGGFDPARDPVISGPLTGLQEPKGVAVDDRAGVVVVTDVATNSVQGFSLGASGNVPPLFKIANLGKAAGGPRQPWGVSVDPERQRLFVAATDGTVVVYDDYLQGAQEPDRVIVPTRGAQRASANLHGILYLPERDLLAVTDFGPAKDSDEAGFDSDGQVLLIENASRADGATEVLAQLSGPNSSLGNPSDLVFAGSSLYVGDKALDAVLRFDEVLGLTGKVDPTPTGAITVVKPESLLGVLSEDHR